MKYWLAQFSIFSQLSDAEIKNIEDFCQEKHLAQGEYLFHEWDEPQALYVLASWSLSVVKWDSKIELAHIAPGSLVGEMAFFWNEKQRSASIFATEDSELIVILAFSLVQLFWKYPDLQEKFHSLIRHREEENKTKGF